MGRFQNYTRFFLSGLLLILIGCSAKVEDLSAQSQAPGGNSGVPSYIPPNLSLTPVNFSNKNVYQLLGACPIGASTLTYSVGSLSGTANCTNGLFIVPLTTSTLTDGSYSVQFTTNVSGQNFTGALIVDKTSPAITLDPVSLVVSALGVSSFPLAGDCTENGAPVSISLASFQTSVPCSNLRFSTVINLTPFAEGVLSLVVSQQDFVGNIGTGTLTITKDTLAPTQILTTGAPAGVSFSSSLSVTVGGLQVSHYRYLLGEASSIDCTNLSGFSPEASVSSPISEPLSGFSSGSTLKLCILGRDESGNWMSLGNMYSTIWLKQTEVTATISGLGSTLFPSASTATRTLTIGGVSVVAYKARAIKSSSCSGVDFSGVAETSVATPFYLEINQGDGGYITCVIGKRGDGTWQATPTASDILTIDTNGPVAVIATTAPNPTSTSPIPYTITFNETITGFTAGDIQITNGVISDFAGSGLLYTFNVSPIGNGSVQVLLGASAVFDVAGNPSSPSNTASRSFGTGFPTLTLTSSSPNKINAGFQVEATFSSSMTGFDSSDMVLTNAIITGFSGSGSSYTINIFPLVDGPVSVSVSADAALDGGSLGNLQSNTLSRIYDTIQPTVVLTSSASNPTRVTPIVIDVVFSETIAGLTDSDFTIVNGTVAGLTGSGSTYSLTVSPIGHGNVSVFLPANRVLDEVSLGNQASSVFERFFDIQQPSISVTTTASDPTNLALIPYNINFTEDVVGFSSADINITNGGISTFSGSGRNYQIEITPSSNGLVTLSIPANIALDLAGNSNLASVPLNRTYDNIIPVVTILTPSENSYINYSNYRSFTLTGACSENTRDVTISGAVTATTSCSSGSWTTNLDFFNAPQGNNTIQVGHRDLAGNYANVVSRQFVLDSIKPTATITSPAQNTLITSGNMAAFTVAGTCSENGKLVTIGGDAAGSTTCSANTWSIILDFSAPADGSVRITAAQTDDASNTTTTAQYAFIKNTTGSAVTFSIDDIDTEEFGMAQFTLSLSAPQAFDVSIDIDVEEDTALNQTNYPTDHDFQRVTRSVTIPAGSSSVFVGVPVFSDARSESSEDFWVRLTNPSVGSILKNLGRGTIKTASVSETLAVHHRKARLDAGRYHTCFTSTDGMLFCWGEGSSGQVGDSNSTKRLAPQRVQWQEPWSAVSAGGLHTCGLKTDDQLYCWGSNTQYQYGPVGSYTYPQSGSFSSIKQVSSGLYHTCAVYYYGAVYTSGSAYCVGSNTNGQIGNNSTSTMSNWTGVTGLSSGVTKISAGDTHSCALQIDQTIKCWGNNNVGQLGDSSNTQRLTPVAVTGISSATMISTGANHTCALLSDSTVRCWGDNSYGQLGDGTNTARNSPTPIVGLNSVIDIAAGDFSTCAVLSSGVIKCWGRNNFGQLGDGSFADSNIPISTSNISNAVTVTVGGEHACAYSQDFKIWCWGRNDTGQVGDGTTVSKTSPINISSDVINGGFNQVWTNGASIWGTKIDGTLWGLGRNDGHSYLGTGTSTHSYQFSQITGITNSSSIKGSQKGVSNEAFCAIDGTQAKCWGYNGYGQLGDGTTNDRNTPTPVQNLAGTPTDIDSDYSMTCSIVHTSTPTDVVQCFGNNNASGGLGQGTGSSITPVTVTGITNAINVAVSGIGDAQVSGCAVLADGSVKCWGNNTYGSVGDGTTSHRGTPVVISGLSNTASIHGKYGAFCAIDSSGSLKCWGHNLYGRLGDGTNTNRLSPVAVSGLPAVSKIRMSPYHSCTLTSDGEVFCWGYNGYGQLGTGDTIDSKTPIKVPGIRGAYDIAVGTYFTCAVLKDRSISCWGFNNADSSYPAPQTYSPMRFPIYLESKKYDTYPLDPFNFSEGVLSYSGGREHDCTLLLDGTIKCWGKNASGQLGNGGYVNSTSAPVTVSGFSSGNSLSAGAYHNCASTSGGAVYCWGDNSYGQLGDGTNVTSSSPVLAISSGVAKVFSGDNHSCAMMTSGAVQCWGQNTSGQLGLGNNTHSNTPQTVIGVSGVTDGSAGLSHSCVVTGSAQISCWGLNDKGQLGNGTTTSTTAPVNVSGLTLASKVFAGARQTCGVLTNGELKCWGSNSLGNLGTDDYSDKTSPVTVLTSANPVKTLATTETMTCAAMMDSSVRCWGKNTDNSLGIRSQDRRNPNAGSTANVINMSAGIKDIFRSARGSVCAQTDANGLKCWGQKP